MSARSRERWARYHAERAAREAAEQSSREADELVAFEARCAEHRAAAIAGGWSEAQDREDEAIEMTPIRWADL